MITFSLPLGQEAASSKYEVGHAGTLQLSAAHLAEVTGGRSDLSVDERKYTGHYHCPCQAVRGRKSYSFENRSDIL